MAADDADTIKTMIKTILIPTDGSEHAAKAVALGADLARKYDARMVLLHVVTDWGTGRVPEELRSYSRLEHVEITDTDVRRAAANEILEQAEALAREHGATQVERILDDGSPAAKILANARASEVDLIVMGSRGLGDLKGLLLGSVSHKVSHLAECTCVTVR